MTGTLFNKSYWIRITDPATLRQIYTAALGEAGFKVVNFAEHVFEPAGYTAVWLLAESHLALHTFPEQGNTYVELTSCNEQKLVHFLDLEEKRQNQQIPISDYE